MIALFAALPVGFAGLSPHTAGRAILVIGVALIVGVLVSSLPGRKQE